MPTIRVDEEVYAALGKRAEPFVDTPNDVLRRLLELMPARQSSVAAIRKGEDERVTDSARRFNGHRVEATPKAVYRRPILEILVEAGGEADVRSVLAKLEQRLGSQHLPGDYARIRSGEVRWENRAKWARKDLQMEGLISSGSRKGFWEVSPAGREWLRTN